MRAFYMAACFETPCGPSARTAKRVIQGLLDISLFVHSPENVNQLYGTQGKFINGKWVPYPIENPEEVEDRRIALGMEPLSEYIRRCERICLPKNV
jgi:hypothetical protein